jgi:hypothetical protein
METQILSMDYRKAAKDALTIQIPICVLFALFLDGGHLARIAASAMIAFWSGAFLVALRRPHHPTRLDLEYWRFGFVPCLVLAMFLSVLIPQWLGTAQR